MSFVSPPVLSVLELFNGPLAGMRFADVDAEGLASLVARVDAAGADVSAAEAKLSELQQALTVQQEALLALAHRALAYARVYAESNEELLSELNGISLPRPAKPRKASAAKSSDVSGPPGAVRAQPEASAAAELNPGAQSIEGRAIELDVESTEASAVPVAPNARKVRRGRAALSEAQPDEDARASASE